MTSSQLFYVLFLFIFNQFKYFLFPLCPLLLSMGYLEVCCFVCKNVGIFQKSFCYWFFIQFCYTQLDLNSFTFIEAWSVLVNITSTLEECTYSCLMRYSINISQVILVDSFVQVFQLFTDFLSVVLLIIKRGLVIFSFWLQICLCLLVVQ